MSRKTEKAYIRLCPEKGLSTEFMHLRVNKFMRYIVHISCINFEAEYV